jgi:imidazolonepropionase-like amidohydrolase
MHRPQETRLPAVLVVLPLLVAGNRSLADSAPTVLVRSARMLDVRSGRVLAQPVLAVGDGRIQNVATGNSLPPPVGATVIDLGDLTLLPGLIDAHVHLFLHPGAEDMQTLRESVPERTILATLAAREDLMAGFTSERDMGTEGAGSADTAVRDAINAGEISGPRMLVSGNAISIVGGHEEAVGFNPALLVPPNATLATGPLELVAVMRQQFKEGADFAKIYETGKDSLSDGRFSTPYQFSEDELTAAVREAARLGRRVAVHATGEPGTGYAAHAGVVSIDHAYQLSPETMRVMVQHGIYAVPTFAIMDYFATHSETAEQASRAQALLAYHAEHFRKQMAAGVKFALGSDVGPFPHGTQAKEFELMVRFGMTPAKAIQAGTINAADLLGLSSQVGALEAGKEADIIGVEGDPLSDITALKRVRFVMKAGRVYKRP